MRSIKKSVMVITIAAGRIVAAAALGVAVAVPVAVAATSADPGIRYHSAPANPDVYYHGGVLADPGIRFHNTPAVLA